MSFAWISDDGVRVIAIVGICKNAGKTSLLNHLLRACSDKNAYGDVFESKIRFGVFSTGIDGEERDSVFNTAKPAVKLPANTLFCCDAMALDSLGGAVEILASLSNPQRPLWIARSLYRLDTMITGPASVVDQIELSRQMLALGAGKILVDGSLDRKSIALSPDVDAVVLVLGASYGNPAKLETELKRLLRLAALPVFDTGPDEYKLLLGSDELLTSDGLTWQSTSLQTLSGKESELDKMLRNNLSSSRLYIPGAVTNSSLDALLSLLPKRPYTLVLRHPDCLKLDISSLQKLAERVELTTLIPFRLKGFAINSEGVGLASEDAARFRSRLRTSFPQLDLIDIMELTHA